MHDSYPCASGEVCGGHGRVTVYADSCIKCAPLCTDCGKPLDGEDLDGHINNPKRPGPDDTRCARCSAALARESKENTHVTEYKTDTYGRRRAVDPDAEYDTER